MFKAPDNAVLRSSDGSTRSKHFLTSRKYRRIASKEPTTSSKMHEIHRDQENHHVFCVDTNTCLNLFWSCPTKKMDFKLEPSQIPTTAMDTPALLDTASWIAAAAKPWGWTWSTARIVATWVWPKRPARSYDCLESTDDVWWKTMKAWRCKKQNMLRQALPSPAATMSLPGKQCGGTIGDAVGVKWIKKLIRDDKGTSVKLIFGLWFHETKITTVVEHLWAIAFVGINSGPNKMCWICGRGWVVSCL